MAQALTAYESVRPVRFTVIASIVLAALWFAPVVGSDFSDADGYLAHVSAIASYDRVGVWTVYQQMAAHFGAGAGWFPAAPVPLALWLVDTTFPLVKATQYLLILCSFGLFAYVARTLFGSTWKAVLAVSLALCAWQFRMPHDPVSGTSLVTTWASTLVLAAYAAWCRYREAGSLPWLLAACVSVVVAMLTGPLGVCLAVALVLLAVAAPGRAAAPATSVLAAVVGVAAVAIGLHGLPPAPWTHGGAYAANVAAQLLAALPTSFRAFGFLPVGQTPDLWHGLHYVDDRFIDIPSITPMGWLAVLACAVAAAWASYRPRATVDGAGIGAALCGIALWLVPALLLGESANWPQGLPFGQAFDGVFLEYMGVGVLGSIVVSALASREGVARRLVPPLVGLAVFVLCYGDVRSDAAVLARSARVDHARALLQRAGAAGFFDALPEGSLIAVPPSMPFARGIRGSDIDARYAIYHYAKRRFDTISARQKDGRVVRGAWLLQIDRPTGMFVSLARLAGGSSDKPIADRALGFTTFETIWRPAEHDRRGLRESVTRLRDGRALSLQRTCGPVRLADVFEPDGPTLEWGRGFYMTGPYGYEPPKSPWKFPKIFMGMKGLLTIVPSNCPPTAVNLKAVAVSGAPATLFISSKGHRDKIATSPVPAMFWLRYTPRNDDAIRVLFETDAPRTDFDPVLFRYERDKPRNIRIVIQPDSVWEDITPPRVRPTAAPGKQAP